MIGIVVSRADTASVHIGEQLRSLAEFDQVEDTVYRRDGFELREFEPFHLELDDVANAFDDPDYLVFASRHSGETGPLLSAHFTGNFGEAEYGGSPEELSRTCPWALSRVVNTLQEHAPPNYDVSMECTHHGPTDLGAPGMFVELGSDEAQWNDPEGAKAVARSILDLDGTRPDADRTLVAFGGSHYAPKPTRIVTETDFAIGHIAANWSLEALGDPAKHEALIQSMFEKSDADCAVIEGDHPEVEDRIEEMGYRVVSETWVQETSGYDPALIEDLEVALGTVESGLRFGSVDPKGGSFLVVDLPHDLVDECQGITREGTLDAIASHTIAYDTRENGARPGKRAAFAERSMYESLIDAFQEILEEAFDTVRREDDELVAERSTFDPQRAAELGVPEGPKFGRLASGQSVEIGGETISPSSVEKHELRRFSV